MCRLAAVDVPSFTQVVVDAIPADTHDRSDFLRTLVLRHQVHGFLRTFAELLLHFLGLPSYTWGKHAGQIAGGLHEHLTRFGRL